MSLSSRISGLSLACLPLVVISLLGVSGFLYQPSPSRVYSTELSESKIDAYRSVVQATQELGLSKCKVRSLPLLTEVADLWIKGANEKRLVPLVPVFALDSTEIGAKREILFTNQQIADNLLYAGLDAEKFNNKVEAAKAYMLAFQLTNTLKYSDINANIACTLRQERALSGLERSFDGMTDGQRRDYGRLLKESIQSYDRVQLMINREFKLWEQHVMYRGSPLSQKEREAFIAMKSKVVADQIRGIELVSLARPFGPTRASIVQFLSEGRVAVHNDNISSKRIQKLINLMDPLPADKALVAKR